jgi:cation:H+ antiporter
VPSGLGLLFTAWRFDDALLVSGLATIVAIGYLLILLGRSRFTARNVSFVAMFYLGFAACLAPIIA